MREIIFCGMLALSSFGANAYSVRKADLQCKKNDDCVLVNSACATYVGVAVAKKAEKVYEKKLAKDCNPKENPVASLAEGPPKRAICAGGECILQDEK